MVSVIIVDFSRTLLFPKNTSYKGELNTLHDKLLIDKKYNVLNHFVLNVELLSALDKLKKEKSVDCYMLTEGHMQNMLILQNKLDPVFSKIYSSTEIGFGKRDPNAYRFIAKDLDKNPEEILFIDDNGKNIAAARKANLLAVQFRSTNQILNELHRALKW